MMSSLGAVADHYATLLDHDAVSAEEVISWVDSLIVDLDDPPSPLIEASRSGDSKIKLIAALGKFHRIELPVNVELVQQYVNDFSAYIPEFAQYWESRHVGRTKAGESSVHGVFFALDDFISRQQKSNSLEGKQLQLKLIESLHTIIDDMYVIFACYPAAEGICPVCYNEKERDLIIKTPIRELDRQLACKLLREFGDHFENSEIYRHYLPRMMEVMVPAESCRPDLMIPERMFAKLQYHGFKEWPQEERKTVIKFLKLILFELEFDKEDKVVWISELMALERVE